MREEEDRGRKSFAEIQRECGTIYLREALRKNYRPILTLRGNRWSNLEKESIVGTPRVKDTRGEGAPGFRLIGLEGGGREKGGEP